MVSLCNPILFPPTAIPAQTSISGGSILRTAFFVLHAPPTFSTARNFPKAPKSVLGQKFVYPGAAPDFAAVETQRFKVELLKELSKEKETFGSDIRTVVNVCAEIFSEFMHKDYGGPGTLVIEPFSDMMVALNEKNLPGAPLAARASLLWAQNHVDQDWEDWNSKLRK
ncbi:hypothetical protein ACP275_05G014300 [Erythranthe tilingii]